MVERTFVMIKPDGVGRGLLGECIRRFERRGFILLGIKMQRLSREQAALHYKEHAGKPNALLSRSVAAVLGRTLVYTLPGSERAVEEYLSEITKTLSHALFMINGLDIHGDKSV